jgi:hypothetical protein
VRRRLERRRAGRAVRSRLRGEIREVLKRSARFLAVGLLGWLAVSAALVGTLLLMGHTHGAAFFAGLLVGVLLLLWQHFLLGQGFAQRRIGADAEQWTAAELSKLDSSPWRVFHDVPLEKSNVDHVVVGPGRVYAVETKWTGSRGDERFLRSAAGQAQRQARELAEKLARLGCDREVLPVLVVWGGGVARAFEHKPRLVGDTRVVAGHDSRDWLRRMANASDGSPDHEAQEAVRQMIRPAERARDG